MPGCGSPAPVTDGISYFADRVAFINVVVDDRRNAGKQAVPRIDQ